MAEAYTGLANIYVAQDDLDSAESVYLNALETQPSNVNLYNSAVIFYEKTDQPKKISVLLQDCEDKNVLSAMNDYVSSAPEFSLKEGTYDFLIDQEGFEQGYRPPHLLYNMIRKGEKIEKEYAYTDISIKTKYNL